MRRGEKPAKAKVEAKLPVARKSPKSEDSRVGDLEKRLAEALKREAEGQEQQAATAEILRVISSSPTDLQRMLDAVAANAARLCGARDASIFRREGDVLRVVADHGRPSGATATGGMPLSPHLVTGRAVLERRTIHVHDLLAAQAEYPDSVRYGIRVGTRTIVAAPLISEGTAIGAIAVRRTAVQPFSESQIALLQIFAAQAVIAIENVRLFTETKEALEQQRASGEILGVISSSPTDVQPVFDVIVQSAVRLCGGLHSNVYRVEDGLIHLVAHHNFSPAALEHLQRRFPMPVSQGQGLAAIREGILVHLHDAQTDPEATELTRRTARALGARSVLSVPMLRDRVGIGVIVVSRGEVKPFSDKEIALIRTFADQAVIAIENVRLFKELETRNRALTEALEQQTATAEILRVISGSPTDVQPVFDAIAQNAVNLCEALFSTVFRYDGALIHHAADNYPTAEMRAILTTDYPSPPDRDNATAKAIRERRIVHIEDVLHGTTPMGSREVAIALGYRTLLCVPMLRDGVPIGTINVARREPRPFADKQIELIRTFADQAVIAIENVRLFKELQGRNRDLTQALERETATSEILRVISSSPTDTQPVFDAIAANAARLCDAVNGLVIRFDGQLLHLAAHHNVDPERLAAVRQAYPRPPSRGALSGRAILMRAVVHVPDVSKDPEYTLPAATTIGYRSVLAVPMIHEGVARGTILVARDVVAPFSDTHISLIQTFADQAVIAIENVRLFKELEARNRDLTDALDRQTATADILRTISQAQADVQPVFEVIADSALRLFGAWTGSVWRYEGGLIRLAAARGGLPGSSEAIMKQRGAPSPPIEDSPSSQTVLTCAVQHSVDVDTDPVWGPRFRAEAKYRGFRSFVSVPMLRGGDAVGVIIVTRKQVGGFAPAEIALLQTFADQAVIAVENARLLAELQARTADLGRSVEQLTALGDVGRALSSTLDLDRVLQTIVTRASQLAGTDACSVFEYDEATEAFHLRTTHNLDEEVVALARRTPIRKGEGVQGRMAITRQPVQIPDIAAEDAYRGPLRDILLRTGTRALLAIPMLREDQLIGGLTVAKKTPGEFAPEVIELLQTFATQSALAIQNARLFREIADKSRQLEAASQHKSEFLANMSHELRTPLNAIIGFSEVLAEGMFGEVNEKQTEYLRDILESGQHLLSLINDILDLSKIEAGRMELELTDFDLPQAISNALTLVRGRAGRRGIALYQEVDQRLGQIRGDERKIKQVLLNLLSNALKFTPEGGRVDVRASVVDGRAEISVTDTGVGIAPEDQEAVFEEFRQVGTADKKVEGTGLGLALSRKFIELHGGRIWVKSQVGMGSTFTFTLPLTTDSDNRRPRP